MIWIIILFALLLRLVNLNQSLWWDEAISVVYAMSSSFWWFVTGYPVGDFHPPGYFATLWIWGHLFDFSEYLVRLPSVLFGLLTIYLSFLIGRKLFNTKSGLLASLFLTVAPLHIYYSQEARMYSFSAFTVTFSIYSLTRLVNNQKLGMILYILSTVLVLYSDYLPVFIIPVQFLWVLIYYKKILKKLLLALVTSMLFWIPWLLIFPKQLIGGQITAGQILGWKEVVGGATIKELILLPAKTITGRISFESDLLYALFFVFLAFPFILSLIKLLKSKQDPKQTLLWFWLIFPPAMAFFISFLVPVFAYFRFIFILPAFYLLTVAGILKFNSKSSNILVIWIVLSGILVSAIYLFNPKFHREDWKGAVNFVNKNSDSRTIILHKNTEVPAAFVYYQKESLYTLGAYNRIPVKSADDLINLEGKLMEVNKLYILNYLVDITDPDRILEKEIEKLGFRKIRDYDFKGVGFIYEFKKQ